MTVPSGQALINVANQNDTIQTGISTFGSFNNPQSLVISPNNGDLYVLSYNESTTTGHNLILGRYVNNGGYTYDASMGLDGFGHGVAFGIGFNSSSGNQHFWTECNADSTGYGAQINEFKFVTGAHPSGTTGTLYDPGKGTQYTCVVDPTNSYLAIRYLSGGKHYFQAYPLSGGITPDFSQPLISGGAFPQTDADSASGRTFQGWTVAGRYLYTITESSSSSSPANTCYIRSHDLNRTQNNSSGYIAVANHGAPSAANGEIEGITWAESGSTYGLYFMIGDHTGSAYEFNLHGIRR